MSGETFSEIIGLLLLLALFVIIFVFNSQIHVLLNPLLHKLTVMGFRKAKYKIIDTEENLPKDTTPWTWRRAWGITLPIPRTREGEKLLTEGNITLKQAIAWLISASVIYAFLTTSPVSIKNFANLSLQSVLAFISNNLLGSLLSPIGFALITGAIHIIARLFRGKGGWQDFFIVYAAFNAPIIIFLGLATFVYQVFSLEFALLLRGWLPFYLLLVINPITIKVSYKFRWLGAFLINLFVWTIFSFLFVGLYIAFNPGILQK
ncbi:MAG: hypothetical protein IT310_15150 [Anaerolineales bacterium]|nr:hypothetical protein [Anaerolineales bacterium]